MEKNSKRIKEPYEPENTPRPPQKVKPTSKSHDSAKGRPEPSDDRTTKEKGHRQHLLDEQADIDDETTI